MLVIKQNPGYTLCYAYLQCTVLTALKHGVLGAEEIAPCLRALAALAEDILFTVLTNIVTPVPRVQMLSSGLCRHCTHTLHNTYMQPIIYTHNIKDKEKNNLKKIIPSYTRIFCSSA